MKRHGHGHVTVDNIRDIVHGTRLDNAWHVDHNMKQMQMHISWKPLVRHLSERKCHGHPAPRVIALISVKVSIPLHPPIGDQLGDVGREPFHRDSYV